MSLVKSSNPIEGVSSEIVLSVEIDCFVIEWKAMAKSLNLSIDHRYQQTYVKEILISNDKGLEISVYFNFKHIDMIAFELVFAPLQSYSYKKPSRG